jgi:hypothetical protein
MPASRRRASRRLALALMAAATVSFATSGALAASDPVTIVAKAGYSGFVKAQQWMPVTIDVTNSGPDIDGTLEVSAAVTPNGPPIGSASYQTHLSLASGATKHLKAWVIEDQAPSPVSVRIVQNGRVVASADATSGSPATALVGVLSDQPTALDAFGAVHPGGVTATVVHLSLDSLSDSAIQLRAFDLLVVDDFATDTLTTAQRGAITDFVQNGGALLLGTGASWRKTLAGVAPAILPMSIDGTTTLDAVTALDNVSRLEVATGALNPGTRAWLAEGGRPLLVNRFVGGGSVTLATFDWSQEPVAGLSATNPLLRQTLVRTMLSYSSGQNIASAKGGFGGGGSSSITERSGSLMQALVSLPALDLPSLVVVGLLVLAYVLLVGPINYLALRALHRRALAWVTVPLIAVVASAGAFGAGVFSKGRAVQTNQVSIVHLEPGWDRAYQESYTGVLTPTRGDFQVKLTGSPPMVGPLFSNNGGALVGANSDLIQVSSDSNTILLPGMTAFVLRGFATEGLIDAPHLVGDAKLVNGKLTGTIRNDSQVTFTDAVVLASDGYQLLPALAPGATATFEVTPKLANPYGQPAIYTIYGNSYNGYQSGQPTAADRDGIEKTSILSEVVGTSGFSPAIAPMVVAWTKQPNEQITVSGSQPRATSMTAVVLPLTFGSMGAGALPAGLVVSHFTDIEGDTQAGPPDALLMQNGTVTYEFTPEIGTGLHITDAKLDSTNQSPKFAPPGSAQGVQARYWDWSKATWVALDYVAMGTTALPEAAIEPSPNQVRLQMTINGGPVLLAPISLTGTLK